LEKIAKPNYLRVGKPKVLSKTTKIGYGHLSEKS
jgi:hypothetical protein